MNKFIIIFFFLSFISGFSQSNNDEIERIYQIALENHLGKTQSYIEKKIVTYQMSDIYFISKFVPFDLLPKKIGEFELNYLNFSNRKHKRLIKKGARVISIELLKLDGNTISVGLVNFHITFSKGQYVYTNTGSSITLFKYSCDKNKWNFIQSDFN